MDEELQGVPVTETAEVTTEPVSQEQTPAKSDDLDARVNALVEKQIAGRLQSEIQRGVQSELQKRKNRADKQLAEDTRAIERMAQRGLLDEDEKAKQLTAAKKEAEQYKTVWQSDEDEIVLPTPTQPQRQTEPVGRDADKEFRQFVKVTYGFDPQDEGMEYKHVLNALPDDPAVIEFIDAAAEKRAEQGKRRKEAKKVGTTKRDVGSLTGLSTGGTPPAHNPIENISDRSTLAELAAAEAWKNMQHD